MSSFSLNIALAVRLTSLVAHEPPPGDYRHGRRVQRGAHPLPPRGEHAAQPRRERHGGLQSLPIKQETGRVAEGGAGGGKRKAQADERRERTKCRLFSAAVPAASLSLAHAPVLVHRAATLFLLYVFACSSSFQRCSWQLKETEDKREKKKKKTTIKVRAIFSSPLLSWAHLRSFPLSPAVGLALPPAAPHRRSPCREAYQ